MDNAHDQQAQAAAIGWTAVDPRAPRYWTLVGTLGTLWTGIPCGLLASTALPWPAALGIGIAVAVLAFLVVRRHSARRFRNTRYALADDGFLLRTGVWWRRELFVPQQRIQHVDVTESPLARRFGLATLTLHGAGAHLHSAALSGLAVDSAFAVRDLLLQRRPDRVAPAPVDA